MRCQGRDRIAGLGLVVGGGFGVSDETLPHPRTTGEYAMYVRMYIWNKVDLPTNRVLPHERVRTPRHFQHEWRQSRRGNTPSRDYLPQ